jgi:hypothetical protein
VHVFHYHLVTSKVRLVEARYIGKMGFELIARYGWLGDETHWFQPGTSWEELDEMSFRLRLIELGRGAVNVVLQPGHWERPRLDHIGIALDESGYLTVLERAVDLDLKVQDHPGKRTFIVTPAGYRLEVHPPREWIEQTVANREELNLAELHLRADDPHAKAAALAELLELDRDGASVEVGDTVIRFLPGGPEGRPELAAEVLR